MVAVPSKRLIQVALALAGAALVPIVAPSLLAWWGLACAVALVVAVADLVWGLQRTTFPSVSLGRALRVSVGRETRLNLVLENSLPEPSTWRVAAGLPAGLETSLAETTVELPGGAGRHRLAWPVLARERGRFNHVTVGLETASRLGLWSLRKAQQVEADLRSYPSLAADRRAMAAVFLRRSQGGAHAQRVVGRGRDFEKLREYLPGDCYDEIHWKATAKRNKPITKVFQTERTQELFVVIDCSRLAGRPAGAPGQTLLDQYLAAALLLLLAAERKGDRFGLVVFSNRIQQWIRPGQGAGHYAACREALCGVRPDDAPPDVAECVRALRTRIQRRSMLFVLSDLSDPVVAEDFIRHGRLLARQHVVMLNQIPPSSVRPLFPAEPCDDSSALYGRVAGQVRWSELRAAQRKLKAAGLTLHSLRADDLATGLLRQYEETKQLQRL